MTPIVLLCLALSAAPPAVRLDADGFALPHQAVGRLGSLCMYHEWPKAVALSRDGSKSATYSFAASTVRLWDNVTGRLSGEFSLDTKDGRVFMDFADDGSLVVIDRVGGRLIARDGRTGVVRRAAIGHRWCGEAAAFRRDGAVAFTDGTGGVVVLDPRTAKEVARLGRPVARASSPFLYRVAFSPDGDRLAAYHDDQYLTVWDVATGRMLWRAEVGRHEREVPHFFFGDNARRLFLAADDIRTFDAATGKLVSTDALGDGDPFLGIGLDDKTGKVFGVRGNGPLVVFDPRTRRATEPGRTAYSRLGVVRAGVAAVVAGNRLVLSDIADGKPLHDRTADEAIASVAATREGRAVVVRESGAADHYELSTAKRLRRVGPVKGWTAAAFHGLGTASPRAAAVADRDKAAVLDAETGAVAWSAAAKVRTVLGGTSFSPDGKWVAWLLDDGGSPQTLEVRDAATGKVRRSWPVRDVRRGPVWSADGRLVATFDDNATWVVREVAGGIERGRLPGDGNAFAFRPDGRTFAATTASGIAVVPLTGDGTRRGQLLPHESAGTLAYSPDGRLLATADGNLHVGPYLRPVGTGDVDFGPHDHLTHRVRLWDRDGRLVAALRVDEGRVTSMAFAPDGRTLLTGTEAGTCLVWRVPAAAAKDLDAPTWADLADDAKAARAVAKMIAAGDATLPLLEANMRPEADAARESRAVEVLEKIATPRARSLLKKLASGAQGRLTRESHEALSRLRQ